MMNKVAVIVVTYNRKQLLVQNIESLLSQTMYDIMDIIIIDNASSDGTKDTLAKYINSKQIIYINTGANLGGAGGFQYGIKYAAKHHYDYIWVMDDDCMPTPNALEALIGTDWQLGSNYGFLSSKVLWKNKEICTMNVQRRTVFKNVNDFSTPIVPVSMASFVSLFIPTRVVLDVGLPIKEFFIWTDDWEYTRRISRKYKCYLVNKSIVIHKSKSNIGANISNDSPDRLDRYNYLYRNDVYLYRREGIQGFLYELVRLSWHTAKVVMNANDYKMERLRKIWKGTLNGLSFHPKIEKVK